MKKIKRKSKTKEVIIYENYAFMPEFLTKRCRTEDLIAIANSVDK